MGMSSCQRTCCILFFILLSENVDAGNVLIIPMAHTSHAYPMINIGKALKEKYNHTVAVVLPDYLVDNPFLKNNYTDVIVSEKLSTFNFKKITDELFVRIANGERPIWKVMTEFSRFCYYLLEDNKLIEELKKRKFDIAIVMASALGDCLNFIAYKLSIPFIHSGPFYEPIGSSIPYNPSVTPDFPFSVFGESMTFFQRVQNHFMHYVKPLAFNLLYIGEDFSTKYVPEKPYISMKDLRKQCQLTLCDTDVLIDYPRPTMPNVVFVGGLNTSPAKPLTKEFQDLMDAAVNGVVIVSFGSVFQHFPQERLNKMFDAMKQIKDLTFVMRFGTEKSEDGNIIKRPWLPQNDLLGHKNTKAFITHCGHSSVYEALYHGIPMIGVPVYGDQFHDAEIMKNKNYGLYIPLLKLETVQFVNIISEVVNNPTYKNNITKASIVYRSRPETPSERAAFWVDHVMKYGGDYMQNKGSSLPWYIYFGLDVYLFLLIVMILISFIFYKVLRFMSHCLCRKQKVKTS